MSHLPSADRSPAVCAIAWVSWARIRFAPAPTAVLHSRRRSPDSATWQATRAEEHAVSMVIVGPRKPKAYAMRPDATLPAVPAPHSNQHGVSLQPPPNFYYT